MRPLKQDKLYSRKKGATGTIFGAILAVAISAVFVASAEAVIKIQIAEVQDGSVFIKGNDAEKGSQITWEGGAVTTANNKNGGFSFLGVIPSDCLGVLSDGAQTIPVNVLNCTPAAAAPAPVPRTGQINSSATGDDGDLEKGVPWPSPRFTDNGDGTITDNLTGLIWLQNANCQGMKTWADALSFANNLADGQCGLTDGSVVGDWRLPNIRELFSLVDHGRADPPLPENHPFVNFENVDYWSSTRSHDDPNNAWIVVFTFGQVEEQAKSGSRFANAVRGGP